MCVRVYWYVSSGLSYLSCANLTLIYIRHNFQVSTDGKFCLFRLTQFVTLVEVYTLKYTQNAHNMYTKYAQVVVQSTWSIGLKNIKNECVIYIIHICTMQLEK